MSNWTDPRAYILGMTGKQTAQMQQAAAYRALMAYKAHAEKLAQDYHAKPSP